MSTNLNIIRHVSVNDLLPNAPKSVQSFDELIEKISQFGWYQLFMLVIYSIACFTKVMLTMNIVFTAAVPSHYFISEKNISFNDFKKMAEDWKRSEIFNKSIKRTNICNSFNTEPMNNEKNEYYRELSIFLSKTNITYYDKNISFNQLLSETTDNFIKRKNILTLEENNLSDENNSLENKQLIVKDFLIEKYKNLNFNFKLNSFDKLDEFSLYEKEKIFNSFSLPLLVNDETNNSFEINIKSSLKLLNNIVEKNLMKETINQKKESSNDRKKFIYDNTVFQNTLVTEWNLVCDKKILASLAFSMIGLGQLLGCLVWGSFIDKFGRRPIYIATTLLLLCFSLISTFSPNYDFFIIVQFFIGFSSVASTIIALTIAVEISGVKYRAQLSVCINYAWALGLLILPVVAYFIRAWRMLQLILVLINCFLAIFLIFTKESPRWLYANERKTEADLIMRRFAKTNKVIFPVDEIKVLIPANVEKNYSYITMLKNKQLRNITLKLYVLWFSCALVYFCLLLVLPNLSQNIYLNVFLSGLVEFPSFVLSQIIIIYCGRRLPISLSMIASSVFLATALILQYSHSEAKQLNWLIISLLLGSKLFITTAWCLLSCFTTEIYPTVIRARGTTICALFGYMGNVMAPLCPLLQNFDNIIPLLLCCVVSIIAACLSLTLPEMKGKPLIDNPDIYAKNEKTTNCNLEKNNNIL